MISFRVSGIPKGQPRPRAFAFKGKARVYDPGTAEGWKSAIAEAARPHLPESPLLGPLRLRLDFAFPRPKSHFMKRGTLRTDAPSRFTSKPDADNCAKAVMDCLTTLRLWGDDAQVSLLIVGKFYESSSAPGAGVAVSIDQLINAA